MSKQICGIICNCGPNGEPLACGYLVGHEGDHSWSTIPTWAHSDRLKTVEGVQVFFYGLEIPAPEGDSWVAVLRSKLPTREEWAALDGLVTKLAKAEEQLAERDALLSSEKLQHALADYAHEAWSDWMQYLFEKSQTNPDGTVTITAWAAGRWRRKVNTPYAELPDSEQASDLIEAAKMLAVVKAAVARVRGSHVVAEQGDASKQV